MALVLADRVQEYSTTTGTGTLTLSGAYAGFQTFAAGIGNGNTCYYTITSDTNQWEVGIGTVGVGTLARTTLISSSTGAKVSFTGTLTVFVTYPAEKSVNLDASNVMTGYAISGGTINGTTVGATTVAAGSFTTLNSSGDTRLGGLSTNQSLQVNNVASAVNYAQIVGAITTGNPVISAQGGDTNINLALSAKGTGNVTILPTGTNVNTFKISQGYYNTLSYFGVTGTGGFAGVQYNATPASGGVSHVFTANGSPTAQGQNLFAINSAAAGGVSVNYLSTNSNTTGNAPTISADGSDANIDLVLTGKGTGAVALGGSTVANSGFRAIPTTSSVNYIEAKGATTGQPVYLSAQGTDTNIPFIIQAKGTQPFYFVVNNAIQFGAFNTTSAVNYPYATGGSTGNPAVLAAIGSDTNVNLKLVPQGTGTLQFGTYTAGILAQAGYITITDAGGTSRRLLVG